MMPYLTRNALKQVSVLALLVLVPILWLYFADLTISHPLFVGGVAHSSLDARLVAYSSPKTGNGDIYLLDRLRNIHLRITDDSASESYPVISPDGLTVVFSRENGRSAQLWRAGVDGTNKKRLTNSWGYDRYPAFSKDGRELVFTRLVFDLKFRPGTRTSAEIFVLDLESGMESRITNNLEADNCPTFSSDSRQIIFGSNDAIVSYSRENKLTKKIASGWSPFVSPTGRDMVYLSGEYGREIHLLNFDSGEDVLLMSKENGAIICPSFFGSENKKILYVDGDSCLIMELDIANPGMPKTVGKLL